MMMLKDLKEIFISIKSIEVRGESVSIFIHERK